MPGAPSLAVVIPCYNYASFVERAINSVVSQNRTDCEVIVVDDGSTDASWEAICRTGVTAFRIENGGARRACLFGFDKTTAPFVLFLDADDELKPDSIGKIISRLDPKVAKLQFPLTRIDSTGNVISAAFPALEEFRDHDVLAREVLQNGVYKSPPTSGNVFRRDVCELLREAEYDKFVDGVTLFAAPFLGDIVSVSEELGRYRIHSNNDSGLGRLPDASTLERDVGRFLARMNHLDTVIRRLKPGQALSDPRRSYYYRDHSFCIDIASGRRPHLSALPGLLLKVGSLPNPIKNKLALATFYILGSVLPNKKSSALLAYRLGTESRTVLGFAKTVLGRAAPLQTPARRP